MSRPIKFRAWDGVDKCIIQVDMTDGYTWSDIFHYTERYKVMQFTGLLDKNGKEIYEGDICTLDMLATEPRIGVVKYGRYGWYDALGYYLDTKNTESSDDGCYSVWHNTKGKENLEVIGNIYENGELVNGS